MTLNESEKLFRAERMTGIGGSDAAAVVGLSPWAFPIDVYLAKTGQGEPKEVTPAMEWGTLKEPLIREVFEEKTGLKVSRKIDPRTNREVMYRHPKHDFMIAHVDGVILGDDGKPCALLEIKTASQFLAYQWGESGSTTIPSYYMIQIQHTMEVLDLPAAWVVVLIGSSDYRTYYILRDQPAIDALIELEKTFWESHVKLNVPPPVDGSDSYSEYLSNKYPAHNDVELDSTPEIDERLIELQEVRRKLKQLAGNEAFLKNTIKGYMGSAGVLNCDGSKVTYRQSKDIKKINWQAVASTFFPSDLLIAEHTVVKKGNRPFVPPRLPKDGA